MSETEVSMFCKHCKSVKLMMYRDANGSLWGRCLDCHEDTEFGYWYESYPSRYCHDGVENIDWLIPVKEGDEN